MTCNDYQEQISQYIDGELPDKESEGLFRHLSTCSECRGFLRSTLELRSKVHDEMLMEQELTHSVPPTGFTTAFTLPLVALLVAFFLFLGISRFGSNQYVTQYSQHAERGIVTSPSIQGNPF